ncbi:Branched-chain-amino-acid aminotransferase [Euphorbia peplus]|nr:Branched-chain-amino-acid aminotransferase [Euphorbia peplus]
MIGRSSPIHTFFFQSLRVSSFQSQVGACFNFATSAQQAYKPYASSREDYADHMDWDNLGFGLTPTDSMYTMKCNKDGHFEKGHLTRFGNIELSPCAGVLNYGQGIFEGTKAYRKKDGGLVLFRPDENAFRMKIGAERMCMPSPSVHQFIDAVKQTAIANQHWTPPPGKGALYIRPLLMGTGAVLGVGPAPEYTFLTYASPVGIYFKDGSLNLYVEDSYHRASPGGVGGVKSISNYAPVFKAVSAAKKRGYSDVLYLDAVNKKYIEEASASNIFVVKGNVISTPPTNGTILPGITRKCIMEIAEDHGYEVEERAISVDELADAEEVFCTGTAVVVAPVGSITYQAKRTEYRTGAKSVSRKLYEHLVGIQTGLIQDSKGWTMEIN